jgi:protein-tyrosine-phosphatase
MASEHVREAALLCPRALAKTFTLKELAQRGDAVGPRAAGEALSSWLGRLAATGRRDTLLNGRHDDDLDVEDPVGRGRADYEVTADLLDGLLARVVELAFPAGAASERCG